MSNSLLHPESLSSSELIKILHDRGIKGISHDLDKYALVDLFNAHVLPKPQREYKHNRSGKLLQQSQTISDRGKKRVQFNNKRQVRQIISAAKRTSEVDEKSKAQGLVNSLMGVSPSCTVTEASVKLSINFERKRIKLSGAQDSLPAKVPKPETLQDKQSSGEPPDTQPVVPMDISPTRIKLTSAQDRSPIEQPQQEPLQEKQSGGEPLAKKPRVKITWP